MATVLAYLESISRDTNKSETEVMAMAFEVGMRQLWREQVLAKYLRDDLSRDEAIEQVGIDWVELAERQREAMLEDLAWAFEQTD
ncbi:MAG: hypothetical protein KDE45_15300 [Caldilineaceae bacterium]|nr:hypothetical protein [Caldilineaceae bacterium]